MIAVEIGNFHSFGFDITFDKLKKVFKAKGYKFFIGKYDLNIFGIRWKVDTNKFDDYLGCAYLDLNNKKVIAIWPATTDPGAYWLEHPMNKKGTAIMVPGQYRGAYKLGPHGRSGYKALVQRGGRVKVFRDGNKNKKHDMDAATYDNGYFGINIHRSNPYSESYSINKWSAGCQVFKKVDDFNALLDLVKMEEGFYSNETHTYTLLEKGDFK